MGAFLGVLAAGVVAVLALLTALASASASLASSTALLTGQCMSGFLGLVSLAAWAGARCAANHLPGD